VLPGRKISLLFFIPSLGNGGAEKHVLRLINNIDQDHFDIHLALARSGGSYENEILDHINIYRFNQSIKSSSISMILSISKLMNLIKRLNPDLLIPFLTHSIIISSIALGSRTNSYLVACIQNNYSKELLNKPFYLRKLFHYFLLSSLKKAKAVIALSRGVAQDLILNFNIYEQKCHVIYNACHDGNFNLDYKKKINRKFEILACGRLELQKDYPTMLKAFKEVLVGGLDARLTILGRGSLLNQLKKQVEELEIVNSVSFNGFHSDPEKFFRDADLFLLTSSFEGFGNVIVEAMAQGTAVISTSCDFGPNEIINSFQNGILVPVGDYKKIAEEIIHLANDPKLRNRLAISGRKNSLKFSSKRVSKEYETLFSKLIEET